MGQIKLLPDHLINQIAAGEVVERPASVVKELLDNSLDAGASQIAIDIEKGGVGLIRVKDDGTGIHPDDLALALTRHATSKIHHIDDLRHVITMGFRGEALPSIASISRLVIMSGFHLSDHAWMIKCTGQTDQISPEPVSHAQGTTIEVRDLFFNVPARRKYLRTERTEFYQIQLLVRHFAISHPQIAVRLTHNGRQILNLKSFDENREQSRIRDILGNKFVRDSIRVDSQTRSLHLTGWIGKPVAARTLNDAQFFSLNGRCIRDRQVSHAIQQAYQDCLPAGRYACYALNLDIEPSMVDVNVHPAKTEVRFREGRTVHDFIYSTLKIALRDRQKSQPEIPYPEKQAEQLSRRYAGPSPRRHFVNEPATLYRHDLKPAEIRDKPDHESVDEQDRLGNILIVKKDKGLVLIDIKMARAKLCRLQLESELKAGSVVSKPLLFPYSYKPDDQMKTVLKQHLELLGQLGIIIKEQQNGIWQLRQIPSVVTTADPDNFITCLVKTLKDSEHNPEKAVIEMLVLYHAEQVPCHDLERLIDQIKLIDHKDVLRSLSEQELQKLISDQL